MGLFERTMARFGYAPRARIATAVSEAIATAFDEDRRQRSNTQRSYEAAQMSRLNAGWTTQPLSINHSIYRDLRALRARSRQMAKDNDYAKQFLRMVKTNVVGPSGFALQVQALDSQGKVDKLDSATLEKAFAKWSRPGVCEITSKLSFSDLQRLAIELVARDGETLIQEVFGGGPFGYQLRMLDAELLDVNLNKDLERGHKIRMGVELDDVRKPVAYHLFAPEATDPIYGAYLGQKHVRIPAAEIIHAFLVEDVDQLRGVPWMHTTLGRTKQLHGFEEAAVVAARVGASKMGFYESPDGDLSPLADAQETTGEGGSTGAALSAAAGGGEFLQEAEPGHFGHLPPGYKFHEWSPEYPHQHYSAFMKTCLRGISAGLGVNYNSLANDLENVNFSSMRVGTREEREVWKSLQGWFSGVVLERIYPHWLYYALSTGAVRLPFSKFDKFDAARWRGRRWPWDDPKKDVDAHGTAIDKGIASRTRILLEQGEDPEEVWDELEYEHKRLKDILPTPTPAPAGVSVSGDRDDD